MNRAPDTASPAALVFLPLAGAIFLGACLVFIVQPMLGRFILPWFGGSPAVWTACMLFFQVLLLGGYAYAYGLARFANLKRQALIHLGVLLLSLVVLPITPEAPTGAEITHEGPQVTRILMLLAVSVGLPYFTLSTTSPLLQSWAAALMVAHRSGRSPYRLYALANAGSLLALLGYPVVVEPALGAVAQTHVWSVAYGAFVLLAGGTAIQVMRGAASEGTRVSLSSVERGPRAPRGDRLLWVALTAVASALLLATTHAISQDIGVSSSLWVWPLVLYLATFILCFGDERWADRRIWGPALVVSFVALAYVLDQGHRVDAMVQIVVHCLALFAACMVCHGEVVRLKPGPGRLTGFYMATAIGGALGGVFVGLVAPQVFTVYIEQPLCLVTVVALYAWVLWRDPKSWMHGGRLRDPAFEMQRGRLRGVWLTFAVGTLALTVSLGWTLSRRFRGADFMSRSFFGTLQVKQYGEGSNRIVNLLDGRISHGYQFTDPAKRKQPTAYFIPKSGIGLALRYGPEVTPGAGGRRIGILGLGVGTLAAYGREGDRITFYEINPDVVQVARSHFHYLSDSAAAVDVALGDGRLLLEHQDPQLFDVLALDAFSGDAIPTHLMTREAFAVYHRHLAPNGVLAVNISNNHVDMTALVAALAKEMGWKALGATARDQGSPLGKLTSDWMLLSRNDDFLSWAESEGQTSRITAPAKLQLWTDDYAPVLSALE
ncbi:MAG: spermidine synthase [Bradymonadia bacterium]